MQQHLPLGAASRYRHHGAAEPFGAVVRAQPAGEQAVAVGVVDDVAGLDPGAGERTRHHVGPAIEVGPAVADHRRLSGRARRSVHAQQLLARHREHAERVIVAQVRLLGEREARDVGEGLEMRRLHPGGVELLAEMRHAVVGPLQRPMQPVLLQRRKLGARQGFDARLEHVDVRVANCRVRAHGARVHWAEDD